MKQDTSKIAFAICERKVKTKFYFLNGAMCAGKRKAEKTIERSFFQQK